MPTSRAAVFPTSTSQVDWLDWEVVENACVGDGCTANSAIKTYNLSESTFTDSYKRGIFYINGFNFVAECELKFCYDTDESVFLEYKETREGWHFVEGISEYKRVTELGFEKIAAGNVYMPSDISKYFNDIGVEAGERVFFSIDSGTGDVYLIHFDPKEIEVFKEVEKGIVQSEIGDSVYDTSKYGIYPYFVDFDFSQIEDDITNMDPFGNIPSPSNLGEKINNVFLVCSDCMKCKECGKNLVASNGSTVGATASMLKLSPYCAQEHACGFFWEINNGNLEIQSTEGVKCADKRMNGAAFCERHTCKTEGCSKAVIGQNMVDGTCSEISPFQGSDDAYYSFYCVNHFCHEYNCCAEKNSNYSLECEFSTDVGGYIHFSSYCVDHMNDCSRSGCNNEVVSANAWVSGHYKLCQTCYDKYIVNGEISILTCDNCHKKMLEENCTRIGNPFTGDKVLCFNCLKIMIDIRTGKEEDTGNFDTQLYKDVTGANVNVWELEEALNNIKPTNVADNQASSTEASKDQTTTSNEEKPTDLGYYNDKITDDELKVAGRQTCSQCGKETWYFEVDGVKYCYSCGKSADGKEIPHKDVIDDATDSDDDYYASDSGSYYDDYTSSSGSYDDSSTSSSSSYTDTTTCVHSNYPVSNTVSFSNVTETTHLQTWNCSNCNALQQATYEHSYTDGICVCGHKQDAEVPTFELLTPVNASEAKAGEEIRLTVKDDRELKEIKYICLWNENVKAETKALSGTLQDIVITNLPNEAGIYKLYIQEVTDAVGNKSEEKTFEFVVKIGTDGEEAPKEEEPIITGDTGKPEIKISLVDMLATEVKEGEIIKVSVPEGVNEVTFLLSDDQELGYIEYYKNFNNEENEINKETLSGTLKQLTVKDFPDKDGILMINELADNAGNKLKDITFVFEKPEADTVKPQIRLKTPETVEDIKKGESITVEFSDNKQLKEAEYRVTINSKNGESKIEETRQYDSLTYLETLAVIGENVKEITIEIKVSDVSGNIAEGKYVFKLKSSGSAELETEGDAGVWTDDLENNNDMVSTEIDDDEIPEPIGSVSIS